MTDKEPEYNHESDSLTEALGITEERDKELKKYMLELLEDSKISRRLITVMQNDELTEGEKALLIYHMGSFKMFCDQMQSGGSKGLLGLLAEMGGK